jgi:hypothetical protein
MMIPQKRINQPKKKHVQSIVFLSLFAREKTLFIRSLVSSVKFDAAEKNQGHMTSFMKQRKKNTKFKQKQKLMIDSLDRAYDDIHPDMRSYLLCLLKNKTKDTNRKRIIDDQIPIESIWVMLSHQDGKNRFVLWDDYEQWWWKQTEIKTEIPVDQILSVARSVSLPVCNVQTLFDSDFNNPVLKNWISLKGAHHLNHTLSKHNLLENKHNNVSEWFQPSKRKLEQFLRRHEIPPFILWPNILCYYVIIPKTKEEKETDKQQKSIEPNEPWWWKHYHVWPIYHLAHQKRLGQKDQTLFIDVFGRFDKKICGRNYFYGIHRSKILHRMKHFDQLLKQQKYLRSEIVMHKRKKLQHPLVKGIQHRDTRHLTGITLKNEIVLFDLPTRVPIPKSPNPRDIPCLCLE